MAVDKESLQTEKLQINLFNRINAEVASRLGILNHDFVHFFNFKSLFSYNKNAIVFLISCQTVWGIFVKTNSNLLITH